MPYNGRTKRRTYKRKYSNNTSRITKTVKKIVAKMSPPKEYKTIDISDQSSNAWVAGTPVFRLLNGLSNGSNDGQRVGNKIHITSIQFSTSLRSDIVNSITSWRWFIVMDKQTNGAIFSLDDLIENISTSTQIQDSFLEKDYFRRFTLIRSGKITVKNDADDVGMLRYIKFYKKFKKPVAIDYIGTSNLVANIAKNSMYFVIVPLNSWDAGQITMDEQIRLRYLD